MPLSSAGRERLARHGQADPTGQFLYRIDKAHVIVFHQEADRGAVRAAAEAVIELLGLADTEGRGLFVVERTAGHVIAPGLFQRHARIDHIDDVDAGHELIDELLGDFAGHDAVYAWRVASG